jgi:mRNA interferase MazF
VTAGDIVTMEFPFSDLSGSKRRPAIVLALTTRHDFIACQMTSFSDDAQAMSISPSDTLHGRLRGNGFARPNKLFTANRKLVLKTIDRLESQVLVDIRRATAKVITRDRQI